MLCMLTQDKKRTRDREGYILGERNGIGCDGERVVFLVFSISRLASLDTVPIEIRF